MPDRMGKTCRRWRMMSCFTSMAPDHQLLGLTMRVSLEMSQMIR